ncbi:U-box domain-containing protein 52-like isoform X3 [Lotus japonicus]|uniref:U-box domain-containing protein 52-like isoform X3 n=1 Tax=Lotus japonicus TaxID=34305 RepID=UPI00258BBFD1|nr:U-box domain-containing protein 52-like isoform X3 [Lotus japonicus]
MWLQKSQGDRKDGVNGIVAVAIDHDKGSQNALKWAIEHLLTKGGTVVLIHVKHKPSSFSTSASLSTPRIHGIAEHSLVCHDPDEHTKEIFRPYRVFCARKDIHCKDVVLEEVDVSKALIEYVTQSSIEHLVIGSSHKTGFLRRFKVADIPGNVAKGAPDFCTVYVVAKGKIQTMRSASRPAPSFTPLQTQINQASTKSTQSDPRVHLTNSVKGLERRSVDAPVKLQDGTESFRSPFNRKGMHDKSYGEISLSDTDITFVSSGRSSTDRMFPSIHIHSDTSMSNPRLSYSSDIDPNHSFESMHCGRTSMDINSSEFSSFSHDSDGLSSSNSSSMDEVEAEMRRLKLELKQTMEMYSTACKEALTAQQKAVELQRWKIEEERRLEEARLAEEAAMAIAEKEKAKSKAAIEAAEAQKRIAELEAQKRINAEMKALREAEEKRKAVDALSNRDVRYRRYAIEEIEAATNFFTESLKIGEGGYGPVYKCLLDHTPVAVKVLRPDAAQGRSQFQREVEVLSCIRHPNMVLLLGACPEYGCLVYEYMANGSLDDRLFCRGNTPPIPWQFRFKIAAEIGTGLLFLHQTKPEPLVHRDLKPANILLDRNYVAKISDVGLARLVPPSVAENVTQYRMTSTAGTFCYIDPEYQQTGMLGVKSDIYSLGVILLQILTARPPMGLTHHVDRAIEKGTFIDMLDQNLQDWPVEDALSLAKMAIRCAELRRKDRPDLGKEVLPELERLKALAENSDQHMMLGGYISPSNHSQVSLHLDGSCSPLPYSGESSRNPSSP